MSVLRKSSFGDLKDGQVWRVGQDGYLHIVTVGKRLIHYRLLKKLTQKAAAGKLAAHDEITRYLENNRAEQVPGLSRSSRKTPPKKPRR